MTKLNLFIFLVASVLIVSSCNNTNQSSDLDLVSKNLDAAIAHNQSEAIYMISSLKEFLVRYETEIIQERKDKIQSTLNNILLLEKEEKKSFEIVQYQILNNEKNLALEMEKVASSVNQFLESINLIIVKNPNTEFALKEIKSILDISSYKLNGTKTENSLALKSIKLAISNAYFKSVEELRMSLSTTPPCDN
jgi:hypothetical protein